MAEKYLRKCSISLAFREMQIKITLRFYLMPVKIAKIKNTSDNSSKRGCEAKRTLLQCWRECKVVKPLHKSIWWFFRTLGTYLPQDPKREIQGSNLHEK